MPRREKGPFPAFPGLRIRHLKTKLERSRIASKILRMHPASDHDFPPFALVTASSEAELGGCEEPETTHVTGGRVSQHIPVGGSEIATISLLLTAQLDTAVEIPARVYRCESFHDLGSGLMASRPLAETSLFWSGAGAGWLSWDVNLTPLSGMKVGAYVRIELDLPPGIGLVQNDQYEAAFPGAVAGADGRLDFPETGCTFCFRVSPAQPCFWAANVLPEAPNRNRFTGIWKSSPAAGLPQWIEASWRDPLLLEEIILEFPDSPERPAHYRLEVSNLNGENHYVQNDDTVQSPAVHTFEPPVTADRIRIDIFTTHGAPSAAIRKIQIRTRS